MICPDCEKPPAENPLGIRQNHGQRPLRVEQTDFETNWIQQSHQLLFRNRLYLLVQPFGIVDLLAEDQVGIDQPLANGFGRFIVDGAWIGLGKGRHDLAYGLFSLQRRNEPIFVAADLKEFSADRVFDNDMRTGRFVARVESQFGTQRKMGIQPLVRGRTVANHCGQASLRVLRRDFSRHVRLPNRPIPNGFPGTMKQVPAERVRIGPYFSGPF